MNNEVKILKPFTRFLMTIGELPSSYLVSMTYEEQLLWFCNYLEKTVIPVINNNSEAVIELQNFVKNYFDNLDLQEEVNNKLDEMAESGELEEIIAEYLNTQAILGFDTLNDLKAANNLIEGSKVRTFGNETYNDKKGSYYYIRTITSGDVVDNINIISLTNYPTLIAEKINNNYLKTYDSITELDNDNTIVSGDKVRIYNSTHEYYTDYIITSDTSGIALSNGLYAKVNGKNIIELNIDDFEEYVEDDEWSTAFTKAFEYIYNSSPNHDLFGIVNLGNRVYTLNDTLTIPNRMMIDGHSVGNLYFTDGTKDYINFVTSSGTFIGNGGGLCNVTIGGTATSPADTTNSSVSALTLGSTASYGTTSGNLNECIFSNITINNAIGNGITINNYVAVLRINRVNIRNVGGNGLVLNRCTDSLFDTFKIDGARLTGMKLLPNSSNNKFSNFKIYGCGLDSNQADLGTLASLNMSNCHRNLFVNIECQDNGGAGLYCANSTYNEFTNFICDKSGISTEAGNYYFYNCSNNYGTLISNNYTETITTALGLFIQGGLYNEFNYISDDKQTGSDSVTNTTSVIYGKNYRHKYLFATNLKKYEGTVSIDNTVPYDYLELVFSENQNNRDYARRCILYKNSTIEVNNVFSSTTQLIENVRKLNLNSDGSVLTLYDMVKFTWTTSGMTITQQSSSEKSLILQEIYLCKD